MPPALTSCRSLWIHRSPWPRLSRHMTTTQWFGSVFGVQVRPVLSPPAAVASSTDDTDETDDTDTTDTTTTAARHSSSAAPEVLPTADAFMASVGRLPPGTAPRRYFVPRELFDDLVGGVGGVDAPCALLPESLPPASPPTVAPSATNALLATAPSTEPRSDAINLDLDAVAGAWPRAPDTTGAPPATHAAVTGNQANKDAVYLRNLVRALEGGDDAGGGEGLRDRPRSLRERLLGFLHHGEGHGEENREEVNGEVTNHGEGKGLLHTDPPRRRPKDGATAMHLVASFLPPLTAMEAPATGVATGVLGSTTIGQETIARATFNSTRSTSTGSDAIGNEAADLTSSLAPPAPPAPPASPLAPLAPPAVLPASLSTSLAHASALATAAAAAAVTPCPLIALLCDEGGGVGWRTTNGATPLHWAAGAGNVPATAALLLRGADPDARTFTWKSGVFGKGSGQTALHWAAESGHDACVRILLDHDPIGALAEDERGTTPAALALVEGRNSVLACLEEHLAATYVCVEVAVVASAAGRMSGAAGGAGAGGGEGAAMLGGGGGGGRPAAVVLPAAASI